MAGLVPATHAKQLRNERKTSAIDGIQLASGDFLAGPDRTRRNFDIAPTF
jgi:hypothetical protein